MARQYFNFDEVWGDRAAECVEELLEMESSLSKTYMALGPSGFAESQREMTSAQSNKELEILKKYGCHIRKIGDTDEDLRKRGELEAYREYEKSLI